MIPIDFYGRNHVLQPPPGHEEDCIPLPCHMDGQVVISCWQPDAEERAIIAAGGPVFLYVFTPGGSPPVAIGTDDPFARLQS